jgi:hypothetical protein
MGTKMELTLPERFLLKIKSEYPIKNWLKLSEKVMKDCRKLFPKQVLFPIELFEQFVIFANKEKYSNIKKSDVRFLLSLESSKLTAAVNWMFSKGVYRLDNDIFKSIISTKINGNIPMDVLLRLPEYCIFFDTKGFDWGDKRIIHGFFAHLDYSTIENEFYLRLLIVNDNDFICMPLVLKLDKNITIKQSLEYIVDSALKETDFKKKDKEWLLHYSRQDFYTNFIQPYISLLLYLCQKEPDIDNDRIPGISPKRAEYKKTKKGNRLFEPKGVKYWNVGVKTGDVLRNSYEKAIAEGKKKAPHLRRAHWHGYWLGPRNGDRVFEYRWLSPIYVCGE